MKPVHEWDEVYILNLPAGEHDWFECKGSKSLDLTLAGVDENRVRAELSRQLSAFSNSGGGCLVYGVASPTASSPRAVDGGGVTVELKGRSTKEWLEDVIPALVELPLSQFNVYQIMRTGASSSITEGKCLIAIDVPDSDNAPHQAQDKKYYARVGGKSRPIGHRMVLDIMGRAKHPRIVVTLKWRRHERRGLQLAVSYGNEGKVYGQYIQGTVQVPAELYKGTTALGARDITDRGVPYKEVWFDNTKQDQVGFRPGLQWPATRPGQLAKTVSSDKDYYVTRYDPLLPNMQRTVYIDVTLSTEGLDVLPPLPVRWRVQADNAPVVTGQLMLTDISLA